MKLVKKCGVIVWSSGPNGINEKGAGDDIFLLRKELKSMICK